MTQNELYHHGILGQKWGVRRYQNYDGSYTQAGMKRYNKSLSAYKDASEKYRVVKQNKSDKSELMSARKEKRVTKRQLNKDYRRLKQDKLADQGKRLYEKGKTIEKNDLMSLALYAAAGIPAIASVASPTASMEKRFKLILASAGIMTIADAKETLNGYEAKRLRAYEAYTSNH